MAANEVNIRFRITEDGTLKMVTAEAKKAAAATDQLTQSRNRYSKGEKGVAGLTNNSTKGFSKMRDAISGSGGLVAAYASLAANVFAVTALFGVLQRATAVQQLEEGLVTLGQQSGIAMRSLSNGLKEATGNAIALEEAMRSTSMVIGAGFDSSTLERLGKVAKNASIALGRDTADSLARLTRGAVKLEPELLDELGIMVRLDEATQEYAKQTGKAASGLTSFERRQAFMNAVLEEGERKYEALNDAVDTNPYDQLAASFADLAKNITTFTNDTLKLTEVVKVLADNALLLSGALLLIGKSAITAAIGALAPAMLNLSASFASSAAGAAKLSARKAKLKASTVSGTKAVNNYADSLSKGEQNSKKFTQAMRFGNQSLTSRFGHLKQHVKQNGFFNKTTIAKTAGVRNATIAVNSLAAAEYRALTATVAFKEQLIFASLANGNFSGALTRLFNQFIRYERAAGTAAAGATKFGAAAIYAGNAAKIAGLGLRFLGASILALLPHIGLIILAIGAIQFALEKLYEKFYETEALKAFTDQVEKSSSVLEELGATLEKIPEIKIFSEQVMARANAINTAVAELDALIEKYAALDVEPLDDRLFKIFDAINISQVFGGLLTGVNPALATAIGTTDMSLGNLIRSTTGFQTTTEQMVSSMREIIQADAAMRAQFEKQYQGQTLEQVLYGEDGTFNLAAYNEINETIVKNEQTKANALDVFTKAAQGARIALRDYMAANIVTTDMDALVTSSDDLGKSLANQTDGASLDKLIDEMTLAEQKFFGIRDVISNDIAGAYDVVNLRTGQATRNTQAYINALTAAANKRAEEIKDDRNRISTGKEIAQNAKNILETTKRQPIFSGQAALIAEQTNTFLDEQITTLEAQERSKQRVLDSMSEEEKKTLTGLTLQAQITQLQSQQGLLTEQKITAAEKALSVAEEDLEILQINQKLQKAALDMDNRRLKAAEQSLDARKKLAEIEIKQQNRADPRRRRDSDLTMLQQFDLEKRFEEEKLKNLQEGIKLKVAQINMEFDLIKAQYAVLAAEIEVINERRRLNGMAEVDTTFLTNAQNTLEATRNATLTGAIQAYVAEYQGTVEKIAELGNKALSDAIKRAFEGDAIDRANVVFGELGAGNKEGTVGRKFDDLENSEKLQAMRGLVTPLIEDLAKLGPEGELIASVTAGAFAIGEAFTFAAEQISALPDNAAKGAATAAASLEAISTAMSVVSEMMSARSNAQIADIDKQIAAEKKRDGKSAESIARINALEKKKDRVKRKAFEQNKKMQMGLVVINTAAAIAANTAAAANAAIAAGIAAPAVFAGTLGILNGITLGLGAAQLALIASTSYQGGGSIGGSGGAPASVSVGQRKTSTDMAKSSGGAGELAYFRGERGQGGPENFRPAFGGMRYRANGGNTAFMVGEQGPEMFVPETPGTIVPSDDVQQAGTPVNATINISAVDAAGVENVLMNQRGNIIGMIREAANAQGDTFLENINVAEL